MADLDRPPLGAEVYETIAVEQHGVHERYWALLKTMKSPHGLLGDGPKPPKQPIRLFKALGEYACDLFDVEAKRYPSDPERQSWLTRLAERIEAMVISNLDQLEIRATFDILHPTLLTYHATKEQMRQAVRSALSIRTGEGDLAKPPVAGTPPKLQIVPKEQITKTKRPERLPSTIFSPTAARKLEDFLSRESIRQTEFAIQVDTTDRTIRRFRKSGRIRHEIFDRIAQRMGMTREALLKSND